MHANLFDHIDIKEENTHLPSSEGSDLQANCKAYNKMLNSTVVDLQLLESKIGRASCRERV